MMSSMKYPMIMINDNDYSQVEQKRKILRMYTFFRLEVHLLRGNDLVAMDRGGKA